LLRDQNTLQSPPSLLGAILFAYQQFAEESTEITSGGQTVGEEGPPREVTTTSAERGAQRWHCQHLLPAGYQELFCETRES